MIDFETMRAQFGESLALLPEHALDALFLLYLIDPERAAEQQKQLAEITPQLLEGLE